MFFKTQFISIISTEKWPNSLQLVTLKLGLYPIHLTLWRQIAMVFFFSHVVKGNYHA